MVKQQITIGHMYPKQMNVYGDMGNVITLRYRMEQRGIDVTYVQLDSLKEAQKSDIDILIGGGGQDSNQGLIQADLMRYAEWLKYVCDDGMVGLMICGMYQLLGKRFVVSKNEIIEGVGVFDLETIAQNDRLIGNVVINSTFGRLVGFENHSGRTYLANDLKPLGSVVSGAGNNGEDGTEGAIYKNVFGTYMHGPALAKNPQLADELIARALARKYGQSKLAPLDDSLEHKAAAIAAKRPR